ncbi:type VI secretion protein IcmF/TssM N-terminal domain-containing protein [Pseudomonas aeruginosa]
MGLTQRLGLSLPVYVVITGMEDLPGFRNFSRRCPGGARARPRLVLAVRRRSGLAVRWCEQALEEITATLTESIVELGTLRGQVDNELYCLPPAPESLRGSLQALLEPVFQGNARGEAPRFRGLYLSGSEAADAAADESPAGGRRAASAQQLRQPTVGTADPLPRKAWPRRCRASSSCVSAGSAGSASPRCACACSGAALMTWVWRDALRDAGELSPNCCMAPVSATSRSTTTLGAPPRSGRTSRPGGKLVSRGAALALHFAGVSQFLVFLLDARIDNAYRRVSERLLVRPLCAALLEGEASDLRAIRSDGQPA